MKKTAHTLWDRNPSVFCVCTECKHLISLDGACTCNAYPTEDNYIPDDIIHRKNNHSEKIAGQVGDYVFTPK